MPAASKAPRRAAGADLSAKRVEARVEDLRGASREMVADMTEAEIEGLALTKLEGLPAGKG